MLTAMCWAVEGLLRRAACGAMPRIACKREWPALGQGRPGAPGRVAGGLSPITSAAAKDRERERIKPSCRIGHSEWGKC